MMGNRPGQEAGAAPNIQIMRGLVYVPPWIMGAGVAFRVLNDSMLPHIKAGFIVFFSKGREVQGGQMGAADVDGETYLCRVWKDNRGFILVFDNRQYERLEVHRREHNASIIGPVAGWLSLSDQERIQRERGSIYV